jgi:hypothetical protein
MMKKIWIVLLVVAMVGALLAVPGTAVAKGGQGGGHGSKPPVEEPSCVSGEPLTLHIGHTEGDYVDFACADVGTISDLRVTFTEYTGNVTFTTRLVDRAGDPCEGEIALYPGEGGEGGVDLGYGSGIMTQNGYLEDGMHYELNTTSCTNGVFNVWLWGKKISGTITVDVDFTPAP